jgi:hypothetical protein
MIKHHGKPGALEIHHWFEGTVKFPPWHLESGPGQDTEHWEKGRKEHTSIYLGVSHRSYLMVIVICNGYNFYPFVFFPHLVSFSPLATTPHDGNLKVYQTHPFGINRRRNKRIRAIIALEQTRCTIGQLLVLTARGLVPAADSSIGTRKYQSRGLITHRLLEQCQPATTFVAS